MTRSEAVKIARAIIEPYRHGNHVSVGVAQLREDIADALMKLDAAKAAPRKE